MAPTAAATADAVTPTPDATAGFLGGLIPLTGLKPSPLNPRKRFDDASMTELTANVAKNGVIVPLIVRRKKGVGEIIDGERRFRAATAAKLGTVPVIFKDDLSDGEVIEIMLLNQIQRQDLTPLEEAHGFKALIESNKAKYSAAYIGDRIGRSEKFVIDRMRLSQLIPILKTLLEAERILVGHAELLCTLKPEDQLRAVDVDTNNRRWQAGHEGLWQTERASLAVTDDEDPDEAPSPKNLYRGLKPVTVKELESWVKRHIRFDVEHMAATAPLEFAPVKAAVDEALAAPGRGKKVIAITHDFRVDDEAKDPSERTYGSQSWERADGQAKSKTCEFSVLGVVVAGRGQGSTLQVCVNRDKCTTHFGKVIKDREKNQKLRQQGKGGQAAQREKKAEETYDQKWKREQAERQAREKAWSTLGPHLEAAAVEQVKGVKALTAAHVKYFEDQYDINIDPGACKKHGFKWATNMPLALLVSEIHHMVGSVDTFDDFVKQLSKPLGLDSKKFESVRDKHAPKPAAAAPAKAATKAKKR